MQYTRCTHICKMIYVLQGIHVLHMCGTYKYYIYICTCMPCNTYITFCKCDIHVLYIYIQNTHVLLTFVTSDVCITRHTRITYVWDIHVLHIYMHNTIKSWTQYRMA